MESFTDAISLAGVIAAAITGAAGVLSLVVGTYRRTLGRRRELARKVEQLAPTMHIDYFSDVLGEAQQRFSSDDGPHEYLWVFDHMYVQALADRTGHVDQYSVTTRTKRFRPTFFRGEIISSEGSSLEVTLGRTRFGDLSSRPDWIQGSLGARRFHYDECYSYGNPGYYQTFAYSLNDAGWVDDSSLINIALRDGGVIDATGGVAALLSRSDISAARGRTAINTLTVTKPSVRLESGAPLGPDRDAVRLVRAPRLLATLKSWMRSIETRRRRRSHRADG